MKTLLAVCVALAILPADGWSAEPVELNVGYLGEAPEFFQPRTQPEMRYYSEEDPSSPISLQDVRNVPSALAPACGPACHCRSRTGNSQEVAFWARMAKEYKYTGYYVGGSVRPGHFSYGEDRYAHEGTWGMDYAPWYSRVQLLWSHGRLFKGGKGAYESDHRNAPLHQRYGRNLRSE